MCVFVCVREGALRCMRSRVCGVCVFEREREREEERVQYIVCTLIGEGDACVCVCAREREQYLADALTGNGGVCACVCVRVCERESSTLQAPLSGKAMYVRVCACVCVRERELPCRRPDRGRRCVCVFVCVCVRERESCTLQAPSSGKAMALILDSGELR